MDSSIDLLNRLIEEGQKFTFENFCYRSEGNDFYGIRPGTHGGLDTPEWFAWKTRVFNLVKELNEQVTPATALVTQAIGIGTKGNGPETFERAKLTFLKALTMTLDALKDDTFGELQQPKSKAANPALSNKVFIVHGHDHALKTDMERFIHEIGLKPVVLHREADQGKTIMEKFEQHSNVGYAFILLTPDDVGYTADQGQLSDDARRKEFRARQNVIFEFGFFVGKLGRSRVCCIHKKGVQLPSDLSGLVYKEVTDSIEPKERSIIQELRAAGYKIKM